MEAKHTPVPLLVRMDGTCSGAWAAIGQECIDLVYMHGGSVETEAGLRAIGGLNE